MSVDCAVGYAPDGLLVAQRGDGRAATDATRTQGGRKALPPQLQGAQEASAAAGDTPHAYPGLRAVPPDQRRLRGGRGGGSGSCCAYFCLFAVHFLNF